MPSPIDSNVTAGTVPLEDENRPGIGRSSAVLDEERRQSWEPAIRPTAAPGVADQPSDNPVIDDKPFKNLRG